MDSRVSVISIIIKDEEAAVTVNELLHEFKNYIVGRMAFRTGREKCRSSVWCWTRREM